MRLLVALPLYGQISPHWVINWIKMEKKSVVGIVESIGASLTLAMGKMVTEALERPGWDRLVVLEQDMIPPANAFERMAQHGLEYGVIGATYFMHEWPHHIMAWVAAQPSYYGLLTAEYVHTVVENPALYEVDAVGFGFTGIARHVLEEWNPEVQMWSSPSFAGHDGHFCHEAKRQGHKIWLDSGLVCGHLTEFLVGYSHSQAAVPVWAETMTQMPQQIVTMHGDR